MASTDLPVSSPGGRDPWKALSRYTSARIALGRTGGSARTLTQLDFRLAHARARDAVHASFDTETLVNALRSGGVPAEALVTAVPDKATYLLRPDLGRRLAEVSRSWLASASSGWGRRDLAILVSDGLAAQAAEKHALPTVLALVDLLQREGWTLYPVFVVPFGRVKLQDEVGELLGARHSLMLLGERPGLGSPDSLGAYFTYLPGASRTDADRNCVSNIRSEGLPPPAAARKLAHLLVESAQRKVSGVALKDSETPAAVLQEPVTRP